MADKEVDPYIRETKILGGMSEEDRTKYVIEVIEWLRSRSAWILKAKSKASMMKRFNIVSNQFSGKGEALMICVLWTIKSEFRSAWMELLGTLVEMDKEAGKSP